MTQFTDCTLAGI